MCNLLFITKKNGRKKMIHGRIPGLNQLRELYPSKKALAQVINRSPRYVQDRLTCKKEFTAIEKRLIIADLGDIYTEEDLF